MPEFLSKLKERIGEFWSNLDKSQKNRLYITSGILVVVIAVGIILLTRTNYIPLLTIQDASDAKEIEKTLTDKKIPYKPGSDGQILVDSRYKNEAEFALASSGVTSSGINFTDTWNQLKISSTESDKKQLWNNFKKNNLIAKLRMFDNIKDADVEIAIPEKSEYFIGKNEEKPTAYVRVKTKGEIGQDQVQAIMRIVASSIVGLKSSDVTVVDSNLNLLSQDTGDEVLDRTSSQYKMKLKVKSEWENNVKKLYPGRADNFDGINVVANPVLDFNKKKTTVNEIQKPTGIDDAIVSSQKTQENLKNATPGTEPGLESNPGTGETTTYPTTTTSENSSYDKKSETINRDFTRVLTEQEKALGEINYPESSITVTLWYGERVKDPNKITQEFLDRLKSDVSSATGVLASKISINKYKLATQEVVTETLAEKIKAIIDAYGLFALLLILVIGLMIAAMPKKKSKESLLPDAVLLDEEPTKSGPKFIVPEDEEELPEIDFGEKSEVKKQIEKFVKQKPEAVAQLLRHWLSDEWE